MKVEFKTDRLPPVEQALIEAITGALWEWCQSEDSVSLWEAKTAMGTLWHHRHESPPAGEGAEGYGRCVG